MNNNGRNSFIPAAGGKGVEYAGWQEPLPELVRRLKRRVQGLRDRLEIPAQDVAYWPSAVTGRRIFEPEAKVYNVDVLQTNVGTSPVNVVVPTGRTFNIPMIFPGPGVFVGRWLNVALYMRLHRPDIVGDTETWLPIVTNAGMRCTPGFIVPFTTRFSVFPIQPQLPTTDTDGAAMNPTLYGPPALNYFWRMQNPRNGRWYPDRLASHMMLQPQTLNGVPDDVSYNASPPDGDLFDLKVPWVFERDGQATFEFRPITDFYQFDSSIAGTAAPMLLPFDDRDGGNVRDQRVLVQVELHGDRFESLQDAVHAGALTQRWDNRDGEDRT